MFVDSEAAFKGRVSELGLGAHYEQFVANKWKTLGQFAFGTWYVPGAGDPKVFNDDIIMPLLKCADHEDRHAVRRLFFEAYTAVAGDVNAKMEQRGDDIPRQVPAPEREARFAKVANKLVGLDFANDPELEPSHHLQDLINGMAQAPNNALKHVPWEDCSKREQETLSGNPRIPMLKPDKDGSMKLVNVADPEPAAWSKDGSQNDLLLRYIFKRRAITFEMYDLWSYENCELLSNLLMAEYMRTPPDGFQRVSLDQLWRADQQAFKFLAQKCRAGIRRDGKETRPLDDATPDMLKDPTFRLMLMPAAKPVGAQQGAGRPASGSQDKDVDDKDKELKRLREENARLKKQENNKRRKGNPKGDKGAGKGGNKKGWQDGKDRLVPVLPRALVGKTAVTEEGDPICFNYNLDGCKRVTTKGKNGWIKCDRGYHVCCEPGCFSPDHGLKKH